MSEEPRDLTDDELWAKLGEASGREKADILLDLAHRSGMNDDFAQSLSLAEAGVVEAEACDDEYLHAVALSMCGVALYQLDRYVESAAKHKEAFLLFRDLGDPEDTGRSAWNLSDSLYFAGEFAEAVEFARAAREAYEEFDGGVRIARAYRFEARALESLGRGREALEALYNGRRAAASVPDPALVLNIDDEIASTHTGLDEYAEAVTKLRACLSVAATLDGGERTAYFEFRLGVALGQSGESEDARVHLLRSYDFNRTNGDVGGVASVSHNLAINFWNDEQYDTALEWIDRARAHASACGLLDTGARCDATKAVWLHRLGRYEEAFMVNQGLITFAPDRFRSWARLRSADNRREMGQAEAALAILDDDDEQEDIAGEQLVLEQLEDDDVFSRRVWRNSIRVRCLTELDRHAEASVVADELLAHAKIHDGDPGSLATFYEVRAKATEATEPESSRTDRAHAIALYLAAGAVERAEELSTPFLPTNRSEHAQNN